MTLAFAPRRSHIDRDVRRGGRPVLYLVPPLVDPDGLVERPDRDIPAPERAVSALPGVRGSSDADRVGSGRVVSPGAIGRPIRLTRRGRLVVGLFLATLAMVAVVVSIT